MAKRERSWLSESLLIVISIQGYSAEAAREFELLRMEALGLVDPLTAALEANL
jgi:hypothetical protein